jgi:anti-anti-sigma factor
VRARGRQCLVDARAVRALDSAGAAFLARLSREARRAGSRPLMLPPGPPAARGLAWMHLPERFETAPDPAAARELVRALGEGGVVVAAGDGLAWQGEVTAANAERVWRDTRARVAALGRDGRDVALDLGALRFLDSGGVDVLLRVSELAGSRGGRLVVVGLPPAIRRILELAGADRLLAHVEAGEGAPARLGRRIPAGGGRAARLFRRTPRAAA